MTIKHIVIPGGGPNFPVLYGVLKKLSIEKFWNFNDLESIHGTSCGSIIGCFLLLNYDWEDIDNYLIGRPWQTVYELTPEMLLDAFKKKGIIDISHFEIAFEPLFRANDISINITLKEFYNITKKNFYIYATNFTDMKLVIFNHVTHPDVKLLHAIVMSSAIPPVVQPLFLEDKLYMDGGLFSNNPIRYALKNIKDEKEILGFKINYPDPYFEDLKPDSSIIEYLIQLLSKLAERNDPDATIFTGPPKLTNRIIVSYSSVIKANFWQRLISEPDFRKELIKSGEEYAEIFLNYRNDYNTVETN